MANALTIADSQPKPKGYREFLSGLYRGQKVLKPHH